MNKFVLLAMGSAVVVASYACKVETEDDDGTGGSASSTSTSTSTSTGTGGGGGTTSSSTSTGTAGGGGSSSGAGGGGGGSGDACMDCISTDCPTPMTECMNDASCVGTDCTCCLAYHTDDNCSYDDLDTEGAGYADALALCACEGSCATACADLCQ